MNELKIQSKPNNKLYRENLAKIFGDKEPERGRWMQHPITGKMVKASEYVRPNLKQSPMAFVNHFEPFESPVTGKVVRNKREHQYDLDSTGCRVYEGRQSEQREADRYRAEQKRKLDESISHTLNKTMYEIEHGYRRVTDG